MYLAWQVSGHDLGNRFAMDKDDDSSSCIEYVLDAQGIYILNDIFSYYVLSYRDSL